MRQAIHARARELAAEERGYSLLEVLAAMTLLAIAVIPMVGMLDGALRAVNTSGSYDTARTLANDRLEEARLLGDANPGTETVEDGFTRRVETCATTGSGSCGGGLPEGLLLVNVTVEWEGGSYEVSGILRPTGSPNERAPEGGP